jgi:Spy/CpxP family protein refolding chaperone
MRIGLKTVLVLALAAWASYSANGQPPFGGRGGGMLAPGMLVQNTSVQKELKLSEEQIQKIKDIGQKIQEKHRDDFASLGKLDPEQRREKGQEIFKAIGEETEKGMAEVLKPEQSKRLKQIVLQAKGSQAFNEEEVQKDVKLTDDQKDKIKTLNEDLGGEIREVFQNAQGNFQEAGKKVATLRKETMDKVVALMTDDQKKTWKEMTGDPFEVKFEGGRGRIGGRQPPPPPSDESKKKEKKEKTPKDKEKDKERDKQ